METQAQGEGSWIKETFWNPNPTFLNHYIAEAINNAEQSDIECVKHGTDPLYTSMYIDWLRDAISCNIVAYKIYALLGFLHSNTGFQDYVRSKERNVDLANNFIRLLHHNTQVYVSGLKFDGTLFSTSNQVRDRQIYQFVRIMQTLACTL